MRGGERFERRARAAAVEIAARTSRRVCSATKPRTAAAAVTPRNCWLEVLQRLDCWDLGHTWLWTKPEAAPTGGMPLGNPHRSHYSPGITSADKSNASQVHTAPAVPARSGKPWASRDCLPHSLERNRDESAPGPQSSCPKTFPTVPENFPILITCTAPHALAARAMCNPV